MRRLLGSIAAAAMACALGAAGAQPAQPRAYDVLADPDFALATRSLTAVQSLELAAHLTMGLRQYQKAIPMYEALLKASPGNAGAWAMLAAAYNRVNEPREALDAADIALALAPDTPHYRAERGIASFELGRYDPAIEDLLAFTKAFPVNARARFYLGLAQAARGDVEAGRANLIRARSLNPALSLPADYYLGLIEGSEGRIANARELLSGTLAAFEAADLPVAALARRQLQALDGVVARRIRAAVHQSDARAAHLPGVPAAR